MNDEQNAAEGIEAAKALKKINDALERAVKMLNARLLSERQSVLLKDKLSLSGQQSKVKVDGKLISVISHIILENVTSSNSNKPQPLTDQQLNEKLIDGLLTVGLITAAQLSANPRASTQEINDIFNDAVAQVSRPEFKKAIVPTGKNSKTTKVPAPSSHRLSSKPQVRKLNDISAAMGDSAGQPPLQSQSHKSQAIDLSKIVTAAFVLLGTSSPAIGAGMVGQHVASKHKKHIPEVFRKGATGIATKITGAAISPGAAIGAFLQSKKPSIISGVNNAATGVRDAKKHFSSRVNKPKDRPQQ